jgi:hypothetical protein
MKKEQFGQPLLNTIAWAIEPLGGYPSTADVIALGDYRKFRQIKLNWGL